MRDEVSPHSNKGCSHSIVMLFYKCYDVRRSFWEIVWLRDRRPAAFLQSIVNTSGTDKSTKIHTILKKKLKTIICNEDGRLFSQQTNLLKMNNLQWDNNEKTQKRKRLSKSRQQEKVKIDHNERKMVIISPNL